MFPVIGVACKVYVENFEDSAFFSIVFGGTVMVDVAFVPGVGPKTYEKLIKIGIKTVEELANQNPPILAGLTDLPIPTCRRLVEKAKECLEKGIYPPEPPTPEYRVRCPYCRRTITLTLK